MTTSRSEMSSRLAILALPCLACGTSLLPSGDVRPAACPRCGIALHAPDGAAFPVEVKRALTRRHLTRMFQPFGGESAGWRHLLDTTFRGDIVTMRDPIDGRTARLVVPHSVTANDVWPLALQLAGVAGWAR